MTQKERQLEKRIVALEEEIRRLQAQLVELALRPYPIVSIPAPTPLPWQPNPWFGPAICDGNIGGISHASRLTLS